MSTENVEKIEADFETAKKILEFLERVLKAQQLDYDAHIERLQSLRFLFQRLTTLKGMELAEVARLTELAEAELPESDVVDADEVPF